MKIYMLRRDLLPDNLGRYNSASMVIWGACGFCEKKKGKKAKFDKGNYEN